MEQAKKVLELTVRVGEVLLKNGGEIFRVQETMLRIAKAYGCENFHVYVLANGIFASLDESGEEICKASNPAPDRTVGMGQVRYMPLSSVHLGRVAAVNNLSREIAAGKYTPEEAFEKIEEIDKIPFAPKPLQILMSGIGAGGFCYILGGSPIDSAASFITGLLLWCFVMFLSEKNSNKITLNILSSALVTVTGVLLFSFVIGENMDKIVIGSIIPLVPGVPITNSIRDFLNGDYLSGTIRMIDAILVACCIALGVGIALKFMSLFIGLPM